MQCSAANLLDQWKIIFSKGCFEQLELRYKNVLYVYLYEKKSLNPFLTFSLLKSDRKLVGTFQIPTSGWDKNSKYVPKHVQFIIDNNKIFNQIKILCFSEVIPPGTKSQTRRFFSILDRFCLLFKPPRNMVLE